MDSHVPMVRGFEAKNHKASKILFVYISLSWVLGVYRCTPYRGGL